MKKKRLCKVSNVDQCHYFQLGLFQLLNKSNAQKSNGATVLTFGDVLARKIRDGQLDASAVIRLFE